MSTLPSDPLPLALYVHFPWCVRKCPYCDFNSHALRGTDELPESQYLDALLADLETQAAGVEARRLVSIFMGGGTPSLFSPGTIHALLSAVAARFDIGDAEITLEANPGTFDESHFRGYREAGVNRVSLGVQSFDDRHLARLGRVHDARDALRACEGVRQAGFERINLDLMYGLPGQSADSALADLSQAVALGTEHLSWYQLTIEPNTVFYREQPVLPVADEIAGIMESGFELMSEAGYERYEISAFSKPGAHSRHNMNYWTFGDYLGIGAGAHGKHTTTGGITRTSKTRMPSDYLANPVRRIEKVVPADSLLLEFLMNALRLRSGFTLEQFTRTTGLSRDALVPFIARASARGLVEEEGESVRPTDRGFDFLNETLLLVDD